MRVGTFLSGKVTDLILRVSKHHQKGWTVQLQPADAFGVARSRQDFFLKDLFSLGNLLDLERGHG